MTRARRTLYPSVTAQGSQAIVGGNLTLTPQEASTRPSSVCYCTQLGPTIASFEVTDFLADRSGEVHIKDLRQESKTDHDIRKFAGESLGTVAPGLVRSVILERSQNLGM